MNIIPHYCQNCGASNQLGERDCRECGTRLMLVVFPPSIRHDEGIVPSYYEDHLLERVTLLEIRLSQVAERLAMALDLMLQQSKNTHSDHVLLEALIDSLNTLGTVERDKLAHKWRKKVKTEEKKEIIPDNVEKIRHKISAQNTSEKPELFEHLVNEGMKFLKQNEEKQALRNLERALELSPQNVSLLLFIAETLFLIEKTEASQKYLEDTLLIEPENEKALLFLGLVLADSLQTEKAKEVLSRLPTNSSLGFCKNYILGFISAFEEDWKTSLELFKETLTEIDIPETNYLVGCVYFQLNKLKKSLRYLQKAVETDTNFADAWFMLAVIYQMIGDEAKSYQSLELAWSSKEAGAVCLKFMKRNKQIEILDALPFIRLKDLKKNLIMGNSRRFTKIIWGEVLKILNS